jgi:hypothetical protein
MRGFRRFALCSHARVQLYGFWLSNLLSSRCEPVTDVSVSLNSLHYSLYSANVLKRIDRESKEALEGMCKNRQTNVVFRYGTRYIAHRANDEGDGTGSRHVIAQAVRQWPPTA